MKEDIQKILNSKSFLEDMNKAIESGKSVDYSFNGEDEVANDVFETDIAQRAVIEVLKKYFIE